MTCHKTGDYETGTMAAEDFARHLRECPECREVVRLDDRLERELEMLRLPVAAAGLWERIETTLRAEKEREAAPAAGPVFRRGRWAAFLARRWPVLVPAGALLIALTIVFGTGRGPKSPPSASGLLEREALAEVEVKEKAYIAAIENLGRRAEARLAAMEETRFALYREKLALIDVQIEKCRTALVSNPANAHIRRYFLAALQDKEQTLAEVLGSTN